MTRQEIIDSLKEMRDVCAYSFRFVAARGLADDFCNSLDMEMPQLQKGFGVKCQNLITQLEAGEKIDDR